MHKKIKLKLESLAIRNSLARSQFGEHCEGLFLTSSFIQPNCEISAQRFADPSLGFTYTRTGNPTIVSFEQRLASLENSENCLATSSGMSAILLVILSLLKSNDHIICSHSLFGSTIKLIGSEMARFGIQSSFASQTKIEEWKNLIQINKTKMFFVETPANPLTDICDLIALSNLAKENNILLVVDNTFATPILQKPLNLGADLSLHSGTKFLDGQGRVTLGAVCGSQKLLESMSSLLRCSGLGASVFNSWIIMKSLETLSLRVKAQSQLALELAIWLENQEKNKIKKVFYPGLKSHAQHELAMKQQNNSGGGVLSFEVTGKNPEELRKNAFHVIDSTKMLSITANLGDVKTTITHPASTSHGRLSEEQRQIAGISQGLIRISVGLENLEDIKADILTGLNSL